MTTCFFPFWCPQIPLYCLLLALSFPKVRHKTPSPSYDMCYTRMYYRSFGLFGSYNISNYKAAGGAPAVGSSNGYFDFPINIKKYGLLDRKTGFVQYIHTYSYDRA